MLTCLLIDDRGDCSIQISELLTFYSLKWELADGNVIYINLDGISDRIHPLIRELKLREMQVCIGVASTRFASLIAAHAAEVETPLFISPAQLETFLADQSVSYLPISSGNRERLAMLGLQTLGQIARIDIRELVNQFGREGQLMSELARGIDPTPLPSYRPTVDADEGAWQMSVWDDPPNNKPNHQPVPVAVISDDRGYPKELFVDGIRVFIGSIINFWKIEGRWWTEQRTNYEYFEIAELGAESTSILCHNLDHAKWCIH